MDEGFYKRLLDYMDDAVYFVDTDRKITYWNRAAERLTGFAASEVVGKTCSDNILNHVDDSGTELCYTACPLQHAIDTGENMTARVFLHHKQGYRVPIRVRTAPMYSEDGVIEGGVEVFNDDRESQSAISRIRELEGLAYIDALTGLPNRHLLKIFLDARMDELERQNWPFGLMIMDIDFFKRVNDTYGHQTGDEVLKMVGQTIAGNTRKEDITGRWGGEEFMAVCSMVDHERLLRLAERFRMLIETSHLSGEHEGLGVTISIGATIAQPGESLTEVIERADQCLYESKQNGRNRVTLST